MSANYTELKEKTDEIKDKLDACAKKLEVVKPEEKAKYENPQYRVWSGNIKDLEGFTIGLEEWLNQPLVAEAKRYLLDIKKWSESPEKISLEEIEKDWMFLSDNVREIKDIHMQIRDIRYEGIKKKISTWALSRISEKDIERAKNWATNANKFANSLKQLENKKIESKLAEIVKRDSVDELLKITSFDKDNNEEINRYEGLINAAENVVKSRPSEVKEESILKTYNKADKKIEERISIIRTEINAIKTFLINLEWVEEFHNFRNYKELWTGKRAAMKKDDLESIRSALKNTQYQVELWKEARRKDIESALIRIERMANSIEKENLKKDFVTIQEKVRGINWAKPNLKSLSAIFSQIDQLRKQLYEELIKKLQNEDAISIIEEPEIIKDLGKKKNWNFERFMTALEVVLRNGLIEIEAVEEK